MSTDAKIKNGKLIITLDMERPRPSRSSGKTLVVASSHGVHVTTSTVKGRPVCVAANAFIYPKARKQKT